MIPLIIDTDPGIDDAFAIFYALTCGGFDLRGLTTIFGNVTTARAAENAVWLLDALEQRHVPVAKGAERPLSGQVHQPADMVHGDHGFGTWPAQQAQRPIEAMDAADFLIAQSHLYAGQLQVAAIGPLTNLALAAERDPGFPARIAGLHVMGGAFRAPGNVTAFAEANIHNDPEAAAIVAARYPRLRFIGLDVTDRIPLTLAECQAIAAAQPHWAEFILDISRFYAEFYASVGKTEGPSLHDPAALISILHPELFTFKAGVVSVAVAGENRGQTLFAEADQGVEVALSAQIAKIGAVFGSALRQPLPLAGGA
jgi:inosine-uridine nucleoside N-ribohydrolase